MVTTQYRVVSADSHVTPPPDFWSEYLPREFRDDAPRVESVEEGDFILFEGKRSPVIMLDSMAGKKKEEWTLTGRLKDRRQGGFVVAARLKDCEIDGVDAEVLFGGGPLASSNPEMHLASYGAYNDWLVDFCAGAPDRFAGMAYLPVDHLEQSQAEARRAARRGLKGVVLPAFPPGAPYRDPMYEPLWDTLEELDLPMHIHLGVRMPRFDNGVDFLVDHAMSKVLAAEPVAHFIYAGILERHPGLKLVTVEADFGWAPFVMLYMDHSWRSHGARVKSTLKEPPSFYFRRQVYGTFIIDPVAIRERHTVGLDNLMWSSDYPHSKTTWPDSIKVIEEQTGGLPEDEKHKLIAGNAVKLYHFA